MLHAGAWSVPEFEWGSPHNCPPSNLKPGQAVLVGRTMFETDRLSPERRRRCNAMDEIWVPTEFHRQVFTNSGVIASKYGSSASLEPWCSLRQCASSSLWFWIWHCLTEYHCQVLSDSGVLAVK